MKIKKILLLLSSVAVLAGCQSSSSEEEKKRYEGMTGKETYVAAVQFFNDQVSYYKSQIADSDNITTLESYKLDNRYGVVTKGIYQEEDFMNLNYTITSGHEFHTLFMGEDGYQYEYIDDYSQEVNQMYKDLSTDNSYVIIEAIRKDQDDEITLTLKLEQSVKYQESDEESSVSYIIKDIYINSDGYIVKEVDTYYTDQLFEEVLQDGMSIEYSLFNNKKKDDFEKEIELMKSCEGLHNEEVKEQLGL